MLADNEEPVIPRDDVFDVRDLMPGRDGELVCVCTNALVLHSSKRDLLDALAVAALAQEVDLFVLAGLDYLFHPLFTERNRASFRARRSLRSIMSCAFPPARTDLP
jgi:hypothetical protein